MSDRFEILRNWVLDELFLCVSVRLHIFNCKKFSQIVLSSAPGSPVDFCFSTAMSQRIAELLAIVSFYLHLMGGD